MTEQAESRRSGRFRLGALAREPLVSFLVLGSLLFLYWSVWGGGGPGDAPIVVTTAEIERLAANWERVSQRPPSREELEFLVQTRIREELLVREARRMELDEGDPVIRQRLVEKLESLTLAAAEVEEPSDAELRAFHAAHRDLFVEPARFDFAQVFVDAAGRGGAAAAEATRLLADLRAGADPLTAGDSSRLASRYARRTPGEIAEAFGEEFAETLATLKLGSWEGPVSSLHGLHLVRVSGRTVPLDPAFETVAPKVREELLGERRRLAEEELLASLRERWRVEIEWPDGGSPPTGG